MINPKTLFWRWWYRHHPRPSRHTVDEALTLARAYGLEREVSAALRYGLTPDEALMEWDLCPME